MVEKVSPCALHGVDVAWCPHFFCWGYGCLIVDVQVLAFVLFCYLVLLWRASKTAALLMNDSWHWITKITSSNRIYHTALPECFPRRKAALVCSQNTRCIVRLQDPNVSVAQARANLMPRLATSRHDDTAARRHKHLQPCTLTDLALAHHVLCRDRC